MPASELVTTTGTLYGRIMQESGISLPDGRFITGIDFVSGLIGGGVVAGRSERKVLWDLRKSPHYGLEDNVYTQTQIVRQPKAVYNRNARYIFNPWKVIMGGDAFIHSKHSQYSDANRIFRNLRTPSRVIQRLRGLYNLFVHLPQSMQEDFLHELDCAPCKLEYSPALQLTPKQLSLYHEILNYVPSKKRDDASEMLRLMSAHNICVDKGDIVRREIEHLMGFDVSMVPTRWRSGHLDEAVLTEERVRELKVLLQKKKIRTS